MRIARQADQDAFSCKGKKPNEYFADVQSGCQSYYVCVGGAGGRMNAVKFDCNPNTIFSQASKVCTPKAQWDCSLTFRFYDTRARKHMKGRRKFVTTTTEAPSYVEESEEERDSPPPRRRRPVPSSQNSLPDFRSRRPSQSNSNRNRRPAQSSQDSQSNRRPVQSERDDSRRRRPAQSEEEEEKEEEKENVRERRPVQSERDDSRRRRPAQSEEEEEENVRGRRPVQSERDDSRRRRPAQSEEEEEKEDEKENVRERRPVQSERDDSRRRRPAQSEEEEEENVRGRRPVQSERDDSRRRRPAQSEEEEEKEDEKENVRGRRPVQSNINDIASRRRRPSQPNQNSVPDVRDRRPQEDLKPFEDFESISELDEFNIPVSILQRQTPRPQTPPTESATPASVPQRPAGPGDRPVSLPRRPSVSRTRPAVPGAVPVNSLRRPSVPQLRPEDQAQPSRPFQTSPGEPFDLFDVEPISPQRIAPGRRVPVVRRRRPAVNSEEDGEVRTQATLRPSRRTVRRRRPNSRGRRPRPRPTEATTIATTTTTITTTERPETEAPTEIPEEVTTRGEFPAIPIGDSFPFNPSPPRTELSNNEEDNEEDEGDFNRPRTPFPPRPQRPNNLNNIPERGPPVAVIPRPIDFLNNRERSRRPTEFSNENRRPEAESLDIISNNGARRVPSPNSFRGDNEVRPVDGGIRTSFRPPRTFNNNPFFRPPPSLGGEGGIVFPPPRSANSPRNELQEDKEEERRPQNDLVTPPSSGIPFEPQRPRIINQNPRIQRPRIQRPRTQGVDRPRNQGRRRPDSRAQGPSNNDGRPNRRRNRGRGRRRRPAGPPPAGPAPAGPPQEISGPIEDPFNFDRDFIRQKRDVSDDLGFPLTTSFVCTDKIAGGLYADIETECRMYHICVPMTKGKLVDYKYICPNNTVFNQQQRKCDSPENVQCDLAHHFYLTKKVMHGDAKPKKHYEKVKSVTKNYKSRSDPRFKREIRSEVPPVQCKQSKIGAHFADLESGCSNFYICVPNDFNSGAVRVTLSCLDGYLFDQKTQNCEKASKVSCKKFAPSSDSNIMGVFIEKN
ncbi:hypothetical protein GQR58_016364 [Nymphon striatum]|nr:hypothetical protein GQR58_016364 [Nymphon striatum]